MVVCGGLRWFSRFLTAHGHTDVLSSQILVVVCGGLHRCQPSRNRAGNPAFLPISRIPAFLRKRPAFLALFRNKKNR